jgi:hypothetical protein
MAEDDAARPLIDWANDAAPADLATELLAAFHPAGPPGDGANPGSSFSPFDLVKWLSRSYPNPGRCARQATRPLIGPIREAMQLLEHAELVYVRSMPDFDDASNVNWSATRLGLATLASGKAAVRQRIKDRTGV